jgi:hypothetical protein
MRGAIRRELSRIRHPAPVHIGDWSIHRGKRFSTESLKNECYILKLKYVQRRCPRCIRFETGVVDVHPLVRDALGEPGVVHCALVSTDTSCWACVALTAASGAKLARVLYVKEC